MVNRLHSASHSSIECDVKTNDEPDDRTRLIAFQRQRLETGSTPVVGSSRNVINGLPTIAFECDPIECNCPYEFRNGPNRIRRKNEERKKEKKKIRTKLIE